MSTAELFPDADAEAHALRLISLSLTAFQGCRSFALALDGHNATVRATNGRGKSTLANAWAWLWSGKDAAGREFSPQPVERGLPIHNVDSVAEAIIEIDGERHTLSRTFREVWTKKRGKATSELTGHQTVTAWDGVPISLGEYEARLAQIASPERWRLLSSPSGLADLPWKRRREILLGLCGGASVADALASDPELRALDLHGRTPDEHRRVTEASRGKATKRLAEIPGRIDEATRTLPQGIDGERVTVRLREVERLIGEAATTGDDGPRRERVALETQRRELAARRQADLDGERQRLRGQRQTHADAASEARRKARSLEMDAVTCDRQAAGKAGEWSTLTAEYQALKNPAPAVPGLCPTCSQALPPGQVEDAQARANAARAEARRRNVEQGWTCRRAREALQAQAVASREQAAHWAGVAEAAESDALHLDAQIASLTSHPLDEQIASLVARLAEPAPPAPTDTTALDAEARKLRAALASLDAGAKTRTRIDELETEQRNLGATLEQLERDLYLLDRLNATVAALTEARVNGLFRLATFRLFRAQVNGGVEQCCDILVDGVPWAEGLNTGAKINAGLDIVRVLGERWGMRLPVFVDNAESVAVLEDAGTQVVRLVMDAGVEQLTVEVAG